MGRALSQEDVYFSDAEEVTIENRGGLNFGKVYVYHRGSQEIEAVFLWTPHGITLEGVVEPPREAKNRAIRALAETPAGRKMLGVAEPEPEPEPPSVEDQLRARVAELEAEVAQLRGEELEHGGG